jgi:hypothetical protein
MKHLILLLTFFLCACGEQEVKKIIMKPSPLVDQPGSPKTTACKLSFPKEATLKQIAIETAKLSEQCNLTESDINDFFQNN